MNQTDGTVAFRATMLVVSAALFCGCASENTARGGEPANANVASRPTPTTKVATTRATTKPADPFAVMFDGKTLGNWKTTEFGGEGLVAVDDGKLVVRSGATLSGITWHGPPPPTVNYEIELDAMKLDGSDFVLALTFPYKKDHASLVLGGWGGSLVGISSVNGDDAANNETMKTHEFPKNQWFHVRLRVTDDRIQAWLDKEADPIVDLETAGKEISTRSDIDLAKPLGLSTFQTSAAYKNIKLKKL